MLRTLSISVFLIFSLLNVLPAQQTGSGFGIKFSGFVKTDVMFDSRQTVAAREGHYLLYPTNKMKDVNGDDINAKSTLHILAIQTRLKGDITGPDAFGAKTSGRIEAAFFGTTENDINGFRLRHAFLTLDWEKSSLMIGQFWHPMFVTSVFPGTVSFNTGAPFQPFSRNPQVRFTYHLKNINIIAAAMSQRDFASTGPEGTSTSYLRNTAIPNMHLQLQLTGEKMLLGIGGDWKALTPRLETPHGHKTSNTVNGMSLIGFAKFTFPSFLCKLEGVYGQNLTDHLMLGGYGVEKVDQLTGEETYLPTNVFSAWTDISTGDKIGLGLFAGVTKNIGASNDLSDSWQRGSNIDMIYRISPRILWNSGKTRLAAEVEYTAASYGSILSDQTVEEAEYIGNLRLLLAAYYFF